MSQIQDDVTELALSARLASVWIIVRKLGHQTMVGIQRCYIDLEVSLRIIQMRNSYSVAIWLDRNSLHNDARLYAGHLRSQL